MLWTYRLWTDSKLGQGTCIVWRTNRVLSWFISLEFQGPSVLRITMGQCLHVAFSRMPYPFALKLHQVLSIRVNEVIVTSHCWLIGSGACSTCIILWMVVHMCFNSLCSLVSQYVPIVVMFGVFCIVCVHVWLCALLHLVSCSVFLVRCICTIVGVVGHTISRFRWHRIIVFD